MYKSYTENFTYKYTCTQTDYEVLSNTVIYVGLLLETQYLTASQQLYLEAMFKMNPYTIQDQLDKFFKQLGLSKAKILDWQKYNTFHSQHQGTHALD